jgi:hypothetical protein
MSGDSSVVDSLLFPVEVDPLVVVGPLVVVVLSPEKVSVSPGPELLPEVLSTMPGPEPLLPLVLGSPELLYAAVADVWSVVTGPELVLADVELEDSPKGGSGEGHAESSKHARNECDDETAM